MQVITPTKFEYIVAQAQFNRVTFVNGEWDGSVPYTQDKAIESCLQVWDYLNKVGAEGWQLTNVVTLSEGNNAQLMYLMREKP